MYQLIFHPVEDHKNETSKNVFHKPTLCVKGLEFPMKVKTIPKFERLKKLKMSILELIGIVLTPNQKRTMINHK